MTIQETAGLAGNVDFVNLTFLRGGFVGNTVNYGADYIVQRLGTNRVSARGTLSVPVGYFYWTGDGGSQILLNVSVHFTDERNNQITGTTQWTIN
ncbi:MAG TPA: hypothetical protein VGN09_08410 [Vicinamibacteria bacterium]